MHFADELTKSSAWNVWGQDCGQSIVIELVSDLDSYIDYYYESSSSDFVFKLDPRLEDGDQTALEFLVTLDSPKNYPLILAQQNTISIEWSIFDVPSKITNKVND